MDLFDEAGYAHCSSPAVHPVTEISITGLDGRQAKFQMLPNDRVADLRAKVAVEFGIAVRFNCELVCKDRLLVDSDVISELPTYDLQAVRRTIPREMMIFLARTAEQAERHEDMLHYMEAVAHTPDGFSVEECQLLGVACRHVACQRRSAWRIMVSISQKEQAAGRALEASFAKQYASGLEARLQDLCSSVDLLLDTHILPKLETAQSQECCQKIKAELCRYATEFNEADLASGVAAEDKGLRGDDSSPVMRYLRKFSIC